MDLDKFRKDQKLSIGTLIQLRIELNEIILKMQRYHSLIRRYEIIFEQNKANVKSLDLFEKLKSNIHEIIECFEETFRNDIDDYVEIKYKPINTIKDGVSFGGSHSSFSMEVKLPVSNGISEYNELIKEVESRIIFPILQMPTR